MILIEPVKECFLGRAIQHHLIVTSPAVTAFGDSVCSIDSRRVAKTPLIELVLLQAASILPGVSVLSQVHMEAYLCHGVQKIGIS